MAHKKEIAMAIMPTALQEMAFDCYLIFTCKYPQDPFMYTELGTLDHLRIKEKKSEYAKEKRN